MSDLFGNHIVGFPTRRLNCYNSIVNFKAMFSIQNTFDLSPVDLP